MPRPLSRASVLALCVAAMTFAMTLPGGEARADSSQLCRSISSIALAPTDVVLAPFIAAKDLHYGLKEWGDATFVRVVGVVPGYGYLMAMQVGGAVLRVIGGIFEFPMGLFTFFREDSQSALNRSQDEAWALISEDVGGCPIRIGTSYNSINL